MRVESTLSQMISTAGEKAAYDNACKHLLANKIILAWIMKSCLEEYRGSEISEIASKVHRRRDINLRSSGSSG